MSTTNYSAWWNEVSLLRAVAVRKCIINLADRDLERHHKNGWGGVTWVSIGTRPWNKNRIQEGNGREASMPGNSINNKRRGENV